MPRDWKAEGRCQLMITTKVREKLRALAELADISMAKQLQRMVDRAHGRAFPKRKDP